MLLTEICIKEFHGVHIRPYLSSIAHLSAEVFKEYPYLCDTHEKWEYELWEKYAESEDAVAVLVFDGSTIIGASTGIPLQEESEAYLKPFKERLLDYTRYFYFSDSFLLKPYRNRGIGHHFFDLREDYVKKLGKYASICFCSLDRPEYDPLRPLDYRSLDDFWRKRGFIHHKDMICHLSWKDLEQEEDTEKQLSFWVKDIH